MDVIKTILEAYKYGAFSLDHALEEIEKIIKKREEVAHLQGVVARLREELRQRQEEQGDNYGK